MREKQTFPEFYLGLDLGQLADYTALSIAKVRLADVEIVPGLEKKRLPVYDVAHLQRWPLNTAYTEICSAMKELMGREEIAPFKKKLLLDATGVGVAVCDIFDQAGLKPVRVSIHGGDNATQEGDRWRVPKRDLVASVQAALGTKRLRIADSLPEAALLKEEMKNFRVKINPETAHDSYSHWRECDHDDLLLSLALVCWWGERRGFQAKQTRLIMG